MAAQAEKAIGQRVIAAVDEALQKQKLARRFGHLGLVALQKVAVQPEIGQVRAMTGFGLGDLVGVMDGNVVLTATVDVKKDPKEFGRHGRTLDMPAGETDSPGALPLHLPLLA